MKIYAEDRNSFIEIVEERQGVFSLHKYVQRYDEEEDVSYTLRSIPNPGGKYGSEEIARQNAIRLIRL